MRKLYLFGCGLLAMLALILLPGCMSDVPSPLATPQELIARLHPSETATLPPTLTATPEPSATITPRRSATRPTMATWAKYSTPKFKPEIRKINTPTITPSRTPVLTPGEDLDLLLSFEDKIFQYSLKTWSAKRLVEDKQREMVSEDMQWLLYTNDQGDWILHFPFDGEPQPVSIVRKYDHPFYELPILFSPDSQYLVFVDDEGYKLLKKPFTGTPMLVCRFVFGEQVDLESFLFENQNAPVFAPDGRSFVYRYLGKIYQYQIDRGESVEIAVGDTPQAWSPDGRWLIFNTPRFEDVSPTSFLYMPSGKTIQMDACRWFGKWSPDSSAIPSKSNYSDYYGCRAAPGVSLLVLEDGTPVEKVIYQDLETPDDGRLGFGRMVWDETGEKLYFVKNIQKFTDNQVSPPQEAPLYIESYIMVYDRRSGQTSEVTQFTSHHWFSLMFQRGNAIFFISDDDIGSLLMRLDMATGEVSQVGRMWDTPYSPELIDYPQMLATDDTLLYILDESGENLLMKMDMTTGEVSQVGRVWDRLELDAVIPGTDWVMARISGGHIDIPDWPPILINHRTGEIVVTYFGSVTPSGSYFLGLLPKN